MLLRLVEGVGVGAAVLLVDGTTTGVVEDGAEDETAVGVGVGAVARGGAGLAEQAAVKIVVAASAPTIRRQSTRSGCHATPIRMRGWAAGVSQRMSGTSVDCGIATQPAVADPSVTCRKNALPAPTCTPPGALRVL